jgi:hypothetical protein
MAAARPLRAVQPTTESQPIVAAAPVGGPLRAPVYDAQYDARLLEPEIVDKFSGGAGNRTRVREASKRPSFTCVVGLNLPTGFVDSATT